MGFLNKIGLKKHDDTSDLPPPPPSSKKQQEMPSAQVPKPPESNISDLPSRSSLPELPSEPPRMPSPSEQSPESVAQAHSQELETPTPQMPPSPPQPQSQSPEASGSQMPSAPKKNLSREELRQAFNDVPPIKSAPQTPPQASHAPIDDEAADNFDVDSMVLPEEADESPVSAVQPAPVSSQQDSPQEDSPDLYISVDRYDDIQRRITDLKKQVSNAGSSIDHILDERKQEDKNFSDFIKDLERIQEDLISIDEDLFTKR